MPLPWAGLKSLPSGGEEQRKAREKKAQAYKVARFGCLTRPRLVDSTTDLPSIPAIKKCGYRKPKLTVIQLIALAIINHEGRLPTGCEILSWINRHFPYFRANDRSQIQLQLRMMQLYDEYDPPIIPFDANTLRPANTRMASLFRAHRYVLVIGHLASIFPANPGVFPLLSLPPELRVKIYEYTLSFPCGAWIIGRNQSPGMLPNSLLSSTGGSWGIVNSSYQSRSLSEVLALLQVSKQIFIEAVPIFYRQHRFFIAADSPELPRHSPTMGIDRCNYLRDITISYTHDTALQATWISMFQMLRNCHELKKLTLQISYRDMWWRYLEEISEWPGFDALCLVRGIEELVVHDDKNGHPGDFASIIARHVQEYLEPLLTQPRVDTPNVRITRAMQKKVQFANVPLQPGLPDTTMKRKKSRQSGQEQRGGEGSGGDGEKRQRKRRKTYHSRSPTHTPVTCDRCNATIVAGDTFRGSDIEWWHCDTCGDYDICWSCIRNKQRCNDESHELSKWRDDFDFGNGVNGPGPTGEKMTGITEGAGS